MAVFILEHEMRKLLAFALCTVGLLIGFAAIVYGVANPLDMTAGTIADHATEITALTALMVAAMASGAIGVSMLIEDGGGGGALRSSFYGMETIDADGWPDDHFTERPQSTAPA